MCQFVGLWVCVCVCVLGGGSKTKEKKRYMRFKLDCKTMPKTIKKSANISLKTIQIPKQSKEEPRESGTPQTPGSQDVKNIITLFFGGRWSVLARQNEAKWINLEPRGPIKSVQNGANNYQNAIKMETKAPTCTKNRSPE